MLTETFMRTGTTVEGLPCEVNLVYIKDAPDGAKPLRLHGWYLARDTVPGETDTFDVQDGRDLPWVVAEGIW
jgi:hypothetical protein